MKPLVPALSDFLNPSFLIILLVDLKAVFWNLPTHSPSASPSPGVTCGIKEAERRESPGGDISRIIGGKASSLGAWPWQAAIMCKTCQSQECGGTLVSPYHVITAAHCLPSNVDNFIRNYKVCQHCL